VTRTWFLDTGFVIALVSPRDKYHAIANELSERIEDEGIQLLTTEAILLEIGSALSKRAYREAGTQLIESIVSDHPFIDVEPLTTARLKHGFTLYKTHSDKEWSLTDCISFELMREQGVREALSADEDFTQAGFIPLMRM
jgi:predicted nucleic acid-binding protein